MRRCLAKELAKRIRVTAKTRCGYCLSPQKFVMARLEIENIIPLIKGGTNDEIGLKLAGIRLHHPDSA